MRIVGSDLGLLHTVAIHAVSGLGAVGRVTSTPQNLSSIIDNLIFSRIVANGDSFVTSVSRSLLGDNEIGETVLASGKGMTDLERRTGIALWRQIADAIRAGISADLGDERGKLPPETELAERFGVNRHTVRSAISALVAEGVLRAEQGRGTFIIERKRLTYPIAKRTRFSTGLGDQVQTGHSRLLRHERIQASEDVARALALDVGAPVHCMLTVSSGDDVPLSRSTSWFDAARFPDLISHFERLKSVTKALQASGIDDYVRQSTVIEACHASLEDFELMQLSPGAIILVTRAINADLDGRPVEYSHTRFSADRVNLQVELDSLEGN